MERSRTSFAWENPGFSPENDELAPGSAAESPSGLARRVLFSPDLTEKLRPLPLLETGSGAAPRERLPSWQGFAPARPDTLRFARSNEARPSLPSRPGLVDEENRGVLLHFFANHELLAAELMALALLKFPDAPEAFRRGLAATLREEQRHTRWYLARMRECGVEFGQYPVSPYFWEAVSPMESPLDYVSRLSLTFEQANLDYARHYSTLLAEAGDSKSASILRRIYEDEISHVGYGLHWFRQWKTPGESDWQALEKRLPFPLSPSRAKGNRTGFNEEGRRAAGFDEDYIRRLALFERSKGRTPNVFLFNPEAEHRAARWPEAYHPDKARIAIAESLELLAGFLARRDDVLLVRRAPSEPHLAKLARCGLGMPEIEVLDRNGAIDPAGLLAARKINALRPWSIAPDLASRLAALRPGLADDQALAPWTVDTRGLFSKVEQVRALSRWMGPSHPCTTTEELRDALDELQARGHCDFLLKRAFSTAGSGLTPLRNEDLSELLARPLTQAIVDEGGILLEVRHDRVFDFSVQYRLEGGTMRFVGFVEQVIQGLGGYRGSLCRSKFCRALDAELARFLMDECLPLYDGAGELASDLAAWATARGYEGPLGIDAYVHRTSEGRLVLRPICEVNPRHTMGLVALELKRRIAPGRDLAFAIRKTTDLTEEDDLAEIDANGKLAKGSVVLTEGGERARFAAVARVL
jgi:uncharacterized ferritin-like protein (DUF455 family)